MFSNWPSFISFRFATGLFEVTCENVTVSGSILVA